jgi:hypothetical protein
MQEGGLDKGYVQRFMHILITKKVLSCTCDDIHEMRTKEGRINEQERKDEE